MRDKSIEELWALVTKAARGGSMRARPTKTKRAARHVPTAWQIDPGSLKTERVQFWTADGTMAGVITLREARELVASGSVIVITDQAVSQY